MSCIQEKKVRIQVIYGLKPAYEWRTHADLFSSYIIQDFMGAIQSSYEEL